MTLLPPRAEVSGDPRPTAVDESAIELRGRVNLALSLLNHRAPTRQTIALAKRALEGASITELMGVIE